MQDPKFILSFLQVAAYGDYFITVRNDRTFQVRDVIKLEVSRSDIFRDGKRL